MSLLARIKSVVAKPLVVHTVRYGFIAAVLLAVGYSLYSSWDDITAYLFQLAWQSVLLSFAAVFAGMYANVLAWRVIVRSLDSEVTVASAARITLLGNLAKYLPGSVWAYVAQMELGKRAGIPRARAFVASIIAVGLSTTASLLIGLFGLPSLRATDGGEPFMWVLLALIPVALFCAHPKVLTRLIEIFLRVLRRPPLGHQISWRTVLTATALSAVAFVCFGVHLWLLANAATDPGLDGLFRSVGSFSLAMTIGMLVVIAPSGLGVRDGVITAALAPFVGLTTAVAIAAISRAVFTVADLVAGGAAGISTVAELRKHKTEAKG
ncbi:membrane protein [Actinorhabdospora filicis]|uniref:Membrane protein n=1 Tax=Actinorhabdospora filicis TaxID=1785913 RepID=A0A9W6SNC9_9ACTN|nr:lysylphosphatidylglycerol synthase transmembrane domain-containing protein [Actinorhabdospora filicis]GLZ79096.1 membrane protein [Actinorhabdospora filicis]